MEIEAYRKAQELDLRQSLLKKAINQLEKAHTTELNLNGIINSDTKLDFVKIGKDDHFFVSKSDNFFYKVRLQTIAFFKEELEMVEREFESL